MAESLANITKKKKSNQTKYYIKFLSFYFLASHSYPWNWNFGSMEQVNKCSFSQPFKWILSLPSNPPTIKYNKRLRPGLAHYDNLLNVEINSLKNLKQGLKILSET